MYRFEDFGPELYAALMGEAGAAESLASDLRKLGSGFLFSPEALSEAPILERYFFTTRKIVSCMGMRTSQGRQEGDLSHTDEVIVDARKDGWIRTKSGLYRLGTEVLPAVGK